MAIDNIARGLAAKALSEAQGGGGSNSSVYVVKSTDITNFIPTPQGNMQVTLSQELEDVILEFKKLVYIDWENQFPALYDNVTKVSLFTPVKLANLDGTDVHTFSCVDGTGDITIAFYQNNGNWYFAEITNQLLTQETGQMLFNTELETTLQINSAQTVNDQLSQITYKGVTYGVGGSLYLHNLHIYDSSYDFYVSIYTTSNTAFTKTSLATYLWNDGNYLVFNCSGWYTTGKFATVIRVGSQIAFRIQGYDITNDTNWTVDVGSSFYLSDIVKQV